MNCPSCGSPLNSNDKFCKVCGFNVQNINNNSANINYELENAYMGSYSEKARSNKFSVTAFLFGVLSFFYRKMWLYGIIICFVTLIIPYKLLIIFNVLLGVFYSKIYLYQTSKKVSKIISENNGKSKEELIEICKKQGGTSALGVVIPILIAVLSFVILVFITLIPFVQSSKIIDKASSKNKTIQIEVKELNTKLPSQFNKEPGFYLATDKENYGYCLFNISYMRKLESEDIYLEYLTDKYKNEYDIDLIHREENINGQKWKYVYYNEGDKSYYYYLTKYNEDVYEISTIIQNNKYLCVEAQDFLLSNTEFKK